MNNINYGKSILLKNEFYTKYQKIVEAKKVHKPKPYSEAYCKKLILKNIEKQYCHYVQLRILFQNFLKCHCHMAYRKDIY